MIRKKQELFFKTFHLSYQGKPGELVTPIFEDVINQQLDIHKGYTLISCVPIVKDGNTTEIVLVFDATL